jgi:hypothetical protein
VSARVPGARRDGGPPGQAPAPGVGRALAPRPSGVGGHRCGGACAAWSRATRPRPRVLVPGLASTTRSASTRSASRTARAHGDRRVPRGRRMPQARPLLPDGHDASRAGGAASPRSWAIDPSGKHPLPPLSGGTTLDADRLMRALTSCAARHARCRDPEDRRLVEARRQGSTPSRRASGRDLGGAPLDGTARRAVDRHSTHVPRGQGMGLGRRSSGARASCSPRSPSALRDAPAFARSSAQPRAQRHDDAAARHAAGGRRGRARAGADVPRVGRAGRGQQRVGGGGRAERVGEADPRQRPAPRPVAAERLVPRERARRRVRGRRGDAAGGAGRGARAHADRRVGHDERHARRRRPLAEEVDGGSAG